MVRIEKVEPFWIYSGGGSVVYEGLYPGCEKEESRITPGFCPEQLQGWELSSTEIRRPWGEKGWLRKERESVQFWKG